MTVQFTSTEITTFFSVSRKNMQVCTTSSLKELLLFVAILVFFTEKAKGLPFCNIMTVKYGRTIIVAHNRQRFQPPQ